ncbi:MAG: TraB/GumN family protein [Gammaproteobacteria bacterium]|nr:TraB/GumN family protein [Gammaproteobacteria bacterium]
MSPQSRSRRLLAVALAACLGLALTPATAQAGCPRPPSAESAAPPPPAIHEHGVLWRVDRPGVAASHLFGTIHLDDAEVLTLPEPVRAVFTDSRALVIEVILDAAAQAHYGQAAFSQPDAAVAAVLDAPVYARYVGLAGRYGLAADVAGRLQPWAALNLLARPPGRGQPVLDEYLTREAQRLGIPILGLETMPELLAALAGLPAADQLALLRDTVCDYDAIMAQVPLLRRLYLERDLGGLWRLSLAPVADRDVQQRFLQRLLFGRNAVMLERMLPALAAGGAFVAVGALHLPGSAGLLERLRGRGFRITPVW